MRYKASDSESPSNSTRKRMILRKISEAEIFRTSSMMTVRSGGYVLGILSCTAWCEKGSRARRFTMTSALRTEVPNLAATRRSKRRPALPPSHDESRAAAKAL